MTSTKDTSRPFPASFRLLEARREHCHYVSSCCILQLCCANGLWYVPLSFSLSLCMYFLSVTLEKQSDWEICFPNEDRKLRETAGLTTWLPPSVFDINASGYRMYVVGPTQLLRPRQWSQFFFCSTAIADHCTAHALDRVIDEEARGTRAERSKAKQQHINERRSSHAFWSVRSKCKCCYKCCVRAKG